MFLLAKALRLIPAPLHRMLYRLAHRARVMVWRVWKPDVTGVRVLALDDQGRVLLVRHSYGSPMWMPPGGGLRPNEDPLLAAARELVEETGLILRDARLVAVGGEALHGARHKPRVVVGLAEGMPQPDRREILAASFFALDELPADMPAGMADRIRTQVRGQP
ncbi:hypothetical protein WSK_3193 [Novosphingobium sp. Rr 2-17]|uniref:NUDIX domain-containing protein n=1 Tax=Novosphingobium sp. Rr 2-17 TaxID=555793 RepID=UPI0002698576|nr:NUDIX domain-containing protein [Novosphingobium sp. Rr 2-17]EIZ78218.1 hypothetical protein WSK_3193 [Novosphingobium sp. Rr 2-17]